MLDSSLFSDYYQDMGIFLYLIPIVSCFWAAFALLANKKHSHPQVYLAVCMLVIGIGMILSFWRDRYAATDHNEIIRAINPVMTMFGAISVLFYFMSLLKPQRLTKRYIFFHILFAIVFAGVFFLLEKRYGTTLNWDIILSTPSETAVIIRLSALACLIGFEIYVGIVCLYEYFRYQKFIKETFSYEEDINLNWIGYCIILFAIYAASDLLWMINASVFVKGLFGISAFVATVCLFWLGFRQGEVPIEEENETDLSPAEEHGETTPSNYLMIKQEWLKQSLLDYFLGEKPYLNPDLNLDDVSKALGTNKTYLSQLINREFEMNFYTFVNQYRIDYAIQLIENYDKRTLMTTQLFSDSGFKSRSVFYKLFKETTGYSPTDYISKLEK
ncbi:helix-turn-helix domain-containing protein [Parabacteroides sp. OttesenSCG-928-G07]|nr:helix-turn-helix domain-containing protein [Parabacteroides sp. OttesenSCG-928-G07]